MRSGSYHQTSFLSQVILYGKTTAKKNLRGIQSVAGIIRPKELMNGEEKADQHKRILWASSNYYCHPDLLAGCER